jgi:hypothetical protein
LDFYAAELLYSQQQYEASQLALQRLKSNQATTSAVAPPVSVHSLVDESDGADITASQNGCPSSAISESV